MCAYTIAHRYGVGTYRVLHVLPLDTMTKIVLAHVVLALGLVAHPQFQEFLVEDPLHQFSWVTAGFPVSILLISLVWGRLKL